MRRSLLLASALLVFYACKKSSSSQNSTFGTLTSIRSTQAGNQWVHLDSFQYNSTHNLVKLSSYDFDTISDYIYIDSGSMYFTVNLGTGLPASYTYIWQKFGKPLYPGAAPGMLNSDSTQYTENHNLSYDAQGRLIYDTTVSQSNYSGTTAEYYTYTGNMIIHISFDSSFDGNGNLAWGASTIDTMVLNNNNLTQYMSWQLSNNSSPSQGDHFTINSYSSYANPGWNPAVARCIGGFLQIQGYGEFLSQNLPADGVANWVTDSRGRVTQMHKSDGTVITLNYSN